MQQIKIYTDGSCKSGRGGWAAVLTLGERTKTISGGINATSANRMEMRAAIEGLRALTKPCAVMIITDSEYLANGWKWLKGWQANQWLTKAGEPVKNKDLWLELSGSVGEHTLRFALTEGHGTLEGNVAADTAAGLAADAVNEDTPKDDGYVGKVHTPMSAEVAMAMLDDQASLTGDHAQDSIGDLWGDADIIPY